MKLTAIVGSNCYCRQWNATLTKMLRVMKLTAFLILFACIQVSATGVAQERVTISEKDVSLEKVFSIITKQTGYSFFFSDKQMEKAKKVNINIKDATVKEALTESLKDQPLDFNIEGKTIFIVNKPVPKRTLKDPIDVKGKVIDENGKPIASVTVTIKGTNKQTITDENGEFTLSDIEENAILSFSSVNMEPFIMNVSGQKEILARLKRKTSELDEVQIIAYGQTTKRFQTGNVTTVKAEDIEKQPVKNPLLTLQGRVPGLFITQNSGLPNGGVTVRIQGQNSIRHGNDPLYVIDGVPYSPQLLPTIVNVLGSSGNTSPNPSGSGNPFSFINASDIESVEVLKDADATAIYGSRAANGAILITTKKGAAGKTKFNLNIQSGFGKVAHNVTLLTSQQYLEMRHEAIKNDGLNMNMPPFDNPFFRAVMFPDINGYWDSTRYTDWQRELIGGVANYNDAQLSVSGGNPNTSFIISAGYHKETTVFPGDFSDKKVSTHFGINHTSSNRKFGVQLSVNYLHDYNKLSSFDLTSTALELPPIAPNLKHEDGTLNWETVPDGASVLSTWTNPLSNLYNLYKNKTDNLVVNSIFNYTIAKGLDLRCSFGYTQLLTKEVSTIPIIAQKPEDLASFPGAALYGTTAIKSSIIEPQLTYSRVVGKGKIEALIGETIQQNNSDGEQLIGVGYNSDFMLEDMKSAASVFVNATQNAIYKYNAIFGRLNYNLQQKYIFNLTGRRDGSSRFGAKNRFHNFSSIGGAWIFSQENFFNNNLPWLSFGKIKGSYGTTGSDQIGDYKFMNLYSSIGVGTAYQGASALQPDGIPNPYLQWEKTKKIQSGLELGFFRDRILITLTHFRNRSSNQLLPYSLPYTTGVGAIAALNFPAIIQNSGWEFALNSTNLKNEKLSWTTYFNLTIPKNKLVDFPELANSSYANDLIIGREFTLLKVFDFIGVDPSTGLYQVADKEGKATSSANFSVDRSVLLNMTPKFYGGLQNTIMYGGLQVDFFFQFVKQIGGNYVLGNVPGQMANQPNHVMNRWQKPGDISLVQKFTTGLGANYSAISQAATGAKFSNKVYADASYVRLKNVSISWQLPSTLKNRLHLDNCRLYVHAQNLVTITNYEGLDPETMNSGALPPLRIVTFGIQAGL